MAKKDIKYGDEWVDYITSTPGEHLRKMKALWAGSTTGFYNKAKDSGKIGAPEIRNINAMKRPYLDPQFVWTSARLALGETDEIPEAREDDVFDPIDDAKKWASKKIPEAQRIIKNFEDGKQVTIEDKEKAENDLVLARLVASGKTIDQLNDAEAAEVLKGTRFTAQNFKYGGKEKTLRNEEDRKRFFKELARSQSDDADKSIVGFGEGKQVDEVAIMMQDRSLYHPAMAELDVSKMQDIPKSQDTRFTEQWLDNKLARASESAVEQIITNDHISQDFPWPTKTRIDKINKNRAIRFKNIQKRLADEGKTPITIEEAELQPLPYSPEEFLRQQETRSKGGGAASGSNDDDGNEPDDRGPRGPGGSGGGDGEVTSNPSNFGRPAEDTAPVQPAVPNSASPDVDNSPKDSLEQIFDSYPDSLAVERTDLNELMPKLDETSFEELMGDRRFSVRLATPAALRAMTFRQLQRFVQRTTLEDPRSIDRVMNSLERLKERGALRQEGGLRDWVDAVLREHKNNLS